MHEAQPVFVGRDDAGGVPNPGRPDAPDAPHWAWESVVAVERPRSLAVDPGGTRAVFTLDRDTSDLWLLDLDAVGAAPVRLTTDRPLAAFWEDGGGTWSPDGRRIAYTASGEVRVVDTSTGVVRRLGPASSPVWLDDERLVVGIDRPPMAQPERGPVTALATLHLDDPWPQRLTAGDGDCGEAVVSPDRRRVAHTLFRRDDLNSTSLHVVDVATANGKVLVHRPGSHVRAPVWSPDGERLAFACEEPGWYEVHIADVRTGASQRLTHAAADFSELAWLPDGSALFGVRTRRGRGDLVRIDAGSGTVDTLAAGGVWSSPRVLADGRVVAAHESFTQPPRICTVALDGTVTEVVASAPLAVRAAPHVVPEHVTYRSLDGLAVHGWLYRPPTASAAQPCAVVVQPHGGPTSHTGEEWDGVVQRFVDRGYAWFALNPRGSTSYGREFERANHGVWGVADTWDCLAAHDHLATLDWVDAGRVAIFGASYGSYMALHSVIDDAAHRYSCAVAKYGDCDILTSWAQGDLVGRLDLERMMGHPADHPDAYRAGSPVHRLDGLEVPVLVGHGELDERVHPAQTSQLVAALDRRGATYEVVTYTTEGHGFLHAGPFLHFHRRFERFVDWYLMARRPRGARPDPAEGTP